MEIKLSPKSYICNNCDEGFITPQHCGRPMNLQNVDEDKMWVCWKGDHAPCCGRPAQEVYTPCCDSPNLRAAIDIDDKSVLM